MKVRVGRQCGVRKTAIRMGGRGGGGGEERGGGGWGGGGRQCETRVVWRVMAGKKSPHMGLKRLEGS